MKTKCAICGQIDEVLYEFKYKDFTFGYVLHLCYVCGRKVAETIQSLSESAKKEVE